MSEFRVDTIKNKDGNGKPNFPNGLTLNGVDPVSNSPTWSETGTAPSSLATQNRILAYNKGGKNIVINGNMNIHQRSGSLVPSISASGYYTADRWHFEDTMDTAVYSQIVDTTDFPTNTEFRKSLRTNCNPTAKTSLGVNDTVKILQKFEGQNVQVLKKGTTNAESVTVSFWVKSNLIGTYICELDDIQNSRQVSKSYTINVINTWEYKTLTFPADTTGTLTNDNSARFQIAFWLVAGANFTSGTLNSSAWASYTSGNRAVGQVNFASANTNTFSITGVQMEIGSITNPFEYRSYGEELILCQRYYYRNVPGVSPGVFCNGYANSTTVGEGFVKYPVTMRVIPSTLEQSGTATDYQIGYLQTAAICSSVPLHAVNTTSEGGYIRFTVASGLTTGQGIILRSNTTTAFLGWSAEL